jgi:hypothetical protein
MRHVPVITIIAAVLFFVSPFGIDLFYGAFLSSETISNSLSQFLLGIVLVVAAVVALLEWTVKFYLRRHRGKIAGR